MIMINLMKLSARLRRGFTLIELLVVIAVIGVLAGIVLLAINPAEQLARGRDASRQAAITQIGRALQGYFTASPASQYPAQGTAAIGALVTSGDMKTIPVNALYGGAAASPPPTCAIGNIQSTTTPPSNYCYLVNAGRTDAIVHARLESVLNNASRCTVAGQVGWFVFSTADGRAGLVCSSTEPVVGNQTFVTP